jgi:hypothetical protein
MSAGSVQEADLTLVQVAWKKGPEMVAGLAEAGVQDVSGSQECSLKFRPLSAKLAT